MDVPTDKPWRDPFLAAAFSGWGDASNVATTCAAFLLQNREVTRALEFDPEEYFVLTETRPWVRVGDDGERRIQWPTLAVMSGLGEPRDAAVLIGPEPQLRWRRFAGEVAAFWRARGQGGPVVLLGAFLAGVSHASPVVLTGFATAPELRARLAELGIQASGYEGPTSCHSVLAGAFKAEGVPCLSIWAAVPHYVGAMPNPKACVALLRAVDAVLRLGLDLRDLDDAARTFETQVSLAMTRSGQTLALASGQEPESKPSDPSPGDDPLPPADELLRGVEEFLRKNRPEH
ncbi:MAG TPA: PAC2 family protein [Chloroflexota bacterium]|jgi:proteasome assembly chaperone (PAC2) family protein|nr:PAC2 family protein [Chloroflexota bacterium]